MELKVLSAHQYHKYGKIIQILTVIGDKNNIVLDNKTYGLFDKHNNCCHFVRILGGLRENYLRKEENAPYNIIVVAEPLLDSTKDYNGFVLKLL